MNFESTFTNTLGPGTERGQHNTVLVDDTNSFVESTVVIVDS